MNAQNQDSARMGKTRDIRKDPGIMEYHWSNILVSHNACSEALTWAKTQPTAEVAWSQCRRADWMLWIAGRLCANIEQRKNVVFAACQCARESLQFVPKHEKRVLECILVTEAWTRGEVTLDKVNNARISAYASAAAATAYSAAGAAYSAANYAAGAAYSAANYSAYFAAYSAADASAAAGAAYSAAGAAYSAAHVAAAVYYVAAFNAFGAYSVASASYPDVARSAALAKMADIVREHLSMPNTSQ